jgi:hypothetical protein
MEERRMGEETGRGGGGRNTLQVRNNPQCQTTQQQQAGYAMTAGHKVTAPTLQSLRSGLQTGHSHIRHNGETPCLQFRNNSQRPLSQTTLVSSNAHSGPGDGNPAIVHKEGRGHARVRTIEGRGVSPARSVANRENPVALGARGCSPVVNSACAATSPVSLFTV